MNPVYGSGQLFVSVLGFWRLRLLRGYAKVHALVYVYLHVCVCMCCCATHAPCAVLWHHLATAHTKTDDWGRDCAHSIVYVSVYTGMYVYICVWFCRHGPCPVPHA